MIIKYLPLNITNKIYKYSDNICFYILCNQISHQLINDIIKEYNFENIIRDSYKEYEKRKEKIKYFCENIIRYLVYFNKLEYFYGTDFDAVKTSKALYCRLLPIDVNYRRSLICRTSHDFVGTYIHEIINSYIAYYIYIYNKTDIERYLLVDRHFLQWYMDNLDKIKKNVIKGGQNKLKCANNLLKYLFCIPCDYRTAFIVIENDMEYEELEIDLCDIPFQKNNGTGYFSSNEVITHVYNTVDIEKMILSRKNEIFFRESKVSNIRNLNRKLKQNIVKSNNYCCKSEFKKYISLIFKASSFIFKNIILNNEIIKKLNKQKTLSYQVKHRSHHITYKDDDIYMLHGLFDLDRKYIQIFLKNNILNFKHNYIEVDTIMDAFNKRSNLEKIDFISISFFIKLIKSRFIELIQYKLIITNQYIALIKLLCIYRIFIMSKGCHLPADSRFHHKSFEYSFYHSVLHFEFLIQPTLELLKVNRFDKEYIIYLNILKKLNFNKFYEELNNYLNDDILNTNLNEVINLKEYFISNEENDISTNNKNYTNKTSIEKNYSSPNSHHLIPLVTENFDIILNNSGNIYFSCLFHCLNGNKLYKIIDTYITSIIKVKTENISIYYFQYKIDKLLKPIIYFKYIENIIANLIYHNQLSIFDGTIYDLFKRIDDSKVSYLVNVEIINTYIVYYSLHYKKYEIIEDIINDKYEGISNHLIVDRFYYEKLLIDSKDNNLLKMLMDKLFCIPYSYDKRCRLFYDIRYRFKDFPYDDNLENIKLYLYSSIFKFEKYYYKYEFCNFSNEEVIEKIYKIIDIEKTIYDAENNLWFRDNTRLTILNNSLTKFIKNAFIHVYFIFNELLNNAQLLDYFEKNKDSPDFIDGQIFELLHYFHIPNAEFFYNYFGFSENYNILNNNNNFKKYKSHLIFLKNDFVYKQSDEINLGVDVFQYKLLMNNNIKQLRYYLEYLTDYKTEYNIFKKNKKKICNIYVNYRYKIGISIFEVLIAKKKYIKLMQYMYILNEYGLLAYYINYIRKLIYIYNVTYTNLRKVIDYYSNLYLENNIIKYIITKNDLCIGI